jgi:hypothetical protein
MIATYDDTAAQDNKLVLAGKIPVRKGIQDRNSYTCVYSIQQNISDSTECTADIPSYNTDYVPGDNNRQTTENRDSESTTTSLDLEKSYLDSSPEEPTSV